MNNNRLTNDKHKSKNERAASCYALQLRWPVLPLHTIIDGKCTCKNGNCPSPGKHPSTRNGVKDASIDPLEIRSWWQMWPNANIGIATGDVSGFFVLDVDPKHYGEESLTELEEKHGKLPDTVEAITGSRGRHILFVYPNNMHISNKVDIYPGLDIRGDRGYIVVAPSVHISGRMYEWELSSRPDKIAIAEAPGHPSSLAAEVGSNVRASYC